MLKRLLISIIILFSIVSLCQNTYGKYIMQSGNFLGKINIDRSKPIIELMSIRHTKGDNNNNNNVNFRIKIIEKNIVINKIDVNNIKIEINNANNLNNDYVEIIQFLQEDGYIIYDIKIESEIDIKEAAIIMGNSIIMDIGNQWNDPVKFVYFAENF